MLRRTVVEIRPYAMPMAPSMIWAANPITTNRRKSVSIRQRPASYMISRKACPNSRGAENLMRHDQGGKERGSASEHRPADEAGLGPTVAATDGAALLS